MTDSFSETIEAWWNELLHGLQKYWWGPVVGVLLTIVWGTVEHRFYAAINNHIDSHWASYLAGVLGSSGIRIAVVAMLTIAVPVVIIVIHAYITTGRTEDITAEFIQSQLLPNDWTLPMAMQAMEIAGADMKKETFSFDLIHEIYVVNRGRDITLKSLRAEAQIGSDSWEALEQIRDLGDYELVIERKEPGGAGRGFIVKTTRRALDNFMDKTANGLKSRMGYRGFVRFRFNATKGQAEGKINTKLWIIDALGEEHKVMATGAKDIEPSDGSIGYSLNR